MVRGEEHTAKKNGKRCEDVFHAHREKGVDEDRIACVQKQMLDARCHGGDEQERCLPSKNGTGKPFREVMASVFHKYSFLSA